MDDRRPQQRIFSFGPGGWRPGAGRPPTARRDKIVLHRKRPEITSRFPVHVTLRVWPEAAKLRTANRAQVVRAAIAAAAEGNGFRTIDWSIQSNHIHLVCEGDSSAQLSRGLQGLCIRMARRLNRLAGRKGPVFTERYHLRVLRTPAEVRHARAYVINNYRRHAATRGRRIDHNWVDPLSSWAFFDGWEDLPRHYAGALAEGRAGLAAAAAPQSWLLRIGWRRRGLVSVNETPAAAAAHGARQCERDVHRPGSTQDGKQGGS